jgi:hypothetical protein
MVASLKLASRLPTYVSGCLTIVLSSALVAVAVSCGGDDKGLTGSTDAAASGGGLCAGAIDWAQAATNVGKQATVRGPVTGANYAKSTDGQPTFIDVGKSNWHCPGLTDRFVRRQEPSLVG